MLQINEHVTDFFTQKTKIVEHEVDPEKLNFVVSMPEPDAWVVWRRSACYHDVPKQKETGNTILTVRLCESDRESYLQMRSKDLRYLFKQIDKQNNAANKFDKLHYVGNKDALFEGRLTKARGVECHSTFAHDKGVAAMPYIFFKVEAQSFCSSEDGFVNRPKEARIYTDCNGTHVLGS